MTSGNACKDAAGDDVLQFCYLRLGQPMPVIRHQQVPEPGKADHEKEESSSVKKNHSDYLEMIAELLASPMLAFGGLSTDGVFVEPLRKELDLLDGGIRYARCVGK